MAKRWIQIESGARPRKERTSCKHCHDVIWRKPRRTRSGRYYVETCVCKDCSIENRASLRPTLAVQLTEGLVITNNVEKRLQQSAIAEIPKSLIHYSSEIGFWTVLLCCWTLGILYSIGDLPKPDNNGIRWIIAFAWFGVPFCPAFLVLEILSGPEKEREERIQQRVVELAQQRSQRIQERETFYSSPEWKLLRDIVIFEEGKWCRHCNIMIGADADVTVDHIFPRSKYPERSLERDNLQVLCRSCNSAKGDRD